MALTRAFDYKRATSVEEAASLLASLGEDAKLLAGGHSLIPAMKLRLAAPTTLVDIGGIHTLKRIEDAGDHIHIGALCTHREVETSDVVRARCPALSEAAGQIGDLQVRNSGTIGGSLAHADPAADYPALVLALGAEVEATGASGSRTIGADDFFTGMFATSLDENEILTRVSVPAVGEGAGAAYAKWPNPASRYAVVGVAAYVKVSGGSCSAARVAVTGAAASPFRATGVEDALVGSTLDEATVASVVSGMTDPADLLSDTAGSARYRAHLCEIIATRAISRAAEAAGG